MRPNPPLLDVKLHRCFRSAKTGPWALHVVALELYQMSKVYGSVVAEAHADWLADLQRLQEGVSVSGVAKAAKRERDETHSVEKKRRTSVAMEKGLARAQDQEGAV